MTVMTDTLAPGGSVVLGDRLAPVEVHLSGCSAAPGNVNLAGGHFAIISRLAMSAGGNAAQRVFDAGSGGSRAASGAGSVVIQGTNTGIISTGNGTVIRQRQGAAPVTASEPERGSIVVMPMWSTVITSTEATVTMHRCTNGSVDHTPMRSTH